MNAISQNPNPKFQALKPKYLPYYMHSEVLEILTPKPKTIQKHQHLQSH